MGFWNDPFFMAKYCTFGLPASIVLKIGTSELHCLACGSHILQLKGDLISSVGFLHLPSPSRGSSLSVVATITVTFTDNQAGDPEKRRKLNGLLLRYIVICFPSSPPRRARKARTSVTYWRPSKSGTRWRRSLSVGSLIHPSMGIALSGTC